MANVTRKDVLNKALNVADFWSDDEREVINKMIASLDKKSSKPTKAQLENEGIKAEILEVIADGRKRTAKEIGEEVGYSTPKVSALLRALVLDGKAEKIAGEKSKDAPTYIGKE